MSDPPFATNFSDVDESRYGSLPDGRHVRIWTLRNPAGMEAMICEYGAILVSLKVPDRDGRVTDVTLGYDTLPGWLENVAYFGATIGRFGNRIAGGRFSLDGELYRLACNNDPGGMPCSLHGGESGFSMKLWQGEPFSGEGTRGIRLSYLSRDGEEGYPGDLKVEISYTLTDDSELIWEAEATTTRATVINLMHHSYWNLSGNATTSIENHELTLYADHFLATDAGLIPTGDCVPVAETPMDFRKAKRVGRDIGLPYKPLRVAGGYDHAYLLYGEWEDGTRLAAELYDPQSGRVMRLFTDQVAMQFYSGNFLDGSIAGKGGIRYPHRAGLCLETETWPDAPNQPSAPSAILRPGEIYRHRMIHAFSCE